MFITPSGIHIGNPNDGTCWIAYRFEKLPQVCFRCGLVGHAEALCRNQALDLDTLAPLGPWISPPVPTDLLEKLAAMKVQTETATPTQRNHQHSDRTDNVAEDTIMKDVQYQKG
ncbi:hypothetical protein TSUD_272700 [Trifolium subterraneum]|uniref:Zinc knuckle CX2CX4HX4C domain-containing protein n=1 Tax=Trifolium subterraneum TaxID=3900 RepID=A0A2Z6PJM5_TRISU|nr:hypothetical protein TSUD_272700 [Trifolium subterraneum]